MCPVLEFLGHHLHLSVDVQATLAFLFLEHPKLKLHEAFPLCLGGYFFWLDHSLTSIQSVFTQTMVSLYRTSIHTAHRPPKEKHTHKRNQESQDLCAPTSLCCFLCRSHHSLNSPDQLPFFLFSLTPRVPCGKGPSLS